MYLFWIYPLIPAKHVKCEKTCAKIRMLCSMSFSDSGLRVAHVVIWNWRVIYAIIFLWNTHQRAGLTEHRPKQCARRHCCSATYKLFLFILRDSKNKCTSSDALFIDFTSLRDKITQKVNNWRGNLCYYYVTVTILAALNPLGAEWSPLIGGEDVS